MDNNYKIKPPSIFFRKMKAYVKSYHGETKWIFFWLKMMKYLKKNIMMFGIKSAIALRKLPIGNN